uniref:Uncharacterized protein n=1 Tax=viral metagenome TaxID=1070528 RepID=A0A6M3Y5F4_9ZZZZ
MIGKEDFSKAIEECILRWPSLKGQLTVYYTHLNFMNYEAFEELCHRFVEDFRSMPLPKDFKEAYSEWKKESWEKGSDPIDRPDYIIHFAVNCVKCGKKNTMCIEEPLGESFECRECYTGLTFSEIMARFKKLAETAYPKIEYKKRSGRYDRALEGERVLNVDPIAEMNRVAELKKQARKLLEEEKGVESDDVCPF